MLGAATPLAAAPASATADPADARVVCRSSSPVAGTTADRAPEAHQAGFTVLHTYDKSFATEVGNAVRVGKDKLLPLLPRGYAFRPASELGLGSANDGIVAITNFCGENPRIDGKPPRRATYAEIRVSVLVREPAAAASAGLNIPGALHFYALAAYTNDPRYAATLREADTPVEVVRKITYDHQMNDAGVGDLAVRVPAKRSPFYSSNTGFGYQPAGVLNSVFWHDGRRGTTALHFLNDPAEQGQALSSVYTKPGTPLNRLLDGGGLGPGPTDPVTGFESVSTPSLNLRYPEGSRGRLLLLRKPCGSAATCVER
ncbi:hypothetical protein LRS74_05895 [Streptomyces sp. LX-29]|uniref:hypothetical protein n=1 Tax=Streptomyces sp. LX-29 TaxID=2900152 RepID=UPI00240E126C|nr:hypothetical protein [Streptomyces sp. LX-29]WFB06625.1 hypothetical protein LRS74_05895 [Streptomyces sp. LX-29]